MSFVDLLSNTDLTDILDYNSYPDFLERKEEFCNLIDFFYKFISEPNKYTMMSSNEIFEDLYKKCKHSETAIYDFVKWQELYLPKEVNDSKDNIIEPFPVLIVLYNRYKP